ncbi:MAG: prolipoprotein diacylglyceryl transferase [Actinomycetota bacterium]|nr:prolipoprotein diacylglyceryl transferase [Actinomycetota bacterium]
MGDGVPQGLILAGFKFGIDPLAWEIVSRLEIGPLSISPHGIGIAVGYLAGAQLMVRRARRQGGPDENDIWNALFWALLGALIGARVGYVLGHLPEVTDSGRDILGIFRVWEGGISLIGGITGGILLALPYAIKKRMGVWRSLDLVAPGLALGIVIGRIGDLVIGDHLGEPTNFALGWRCLGDITEGTGPTSATVYLDALDAGEPPSLGCFDLVLHQTAIYDFLSTLALLGVLLWFGRRTRPAGFLFLVFTTWYGTVRVITDFLRVDRTYFGLTGSQLMSLAVLLISLYLLARFRGAPPGWAGTAPSLPPDSGAPAPAPVPVPTGSPGAYAEAELEQDLGSADAESGQRPEMRRSARPEDDAP